MALTATDYIRAEQHGVNYNALRARINRGWDKDEAIATPLNHRSTEFKRLVNLAAENGISENTLKNRLYRQWWTPERAVSEPLRKWTRGGGMHE